MDNEEQNHHTIFVDNEDDFKTWKPEEYFDTIPELVNRKYNRLSKQQLEDEEFVTSLEDEKQLSNMKKHVQLRKNMNGKGKRFKVADGENGHAAVYRWQFERKK